MMIRLIQHRLKLFFACLVINLLRRFGYINVACAFALKAGLGVEIEHKYPSEEKNVSKIQNFHSGDQAKQKQKEEKIFGLEIEREYPTGRRK